MNNQNAGLPLNVSQKIIKLMNSVSEIEKAQVFGSRAKGNFRVGSDIDIAIHGSGLTQEDRSQILLMYDELYLPWKLDLILYDQISEPALKQHIDRIGVTIFPSP